MPERYDAFISYRHNPRDTSVARELQTRLEHYHIPKALQQRTGRRSISRIFRDQNELEVTSDLSAAIDEALAQSDFLICVLSPAYKESVWCIHEIEQFLKTHDYDHILTVLSDGEPPAIFPDLLLHRTVLTTAEDGSEKPVVIDAEPLAWDY
ncbi:MAG: toll/interleukin-1 receptor domain-containing protein, partial [Solobacterium sp.]|nr:toll/interleukin-1 receptor domain-containing protein [Solobacterium sp.]